MVLHDYGVLTQARLNVNIVATRKQLSVLRSVMKYQPVDTYNCIIHSPISHTTLFIILTDMLQLYVDCY